MSVKIPASLLDITSLTSRAPWSVASTRSAPGLAALTPDLAGLEAMARLRSLLASSSQVAPPRPPYSGSSLEQASMSLMRFLYQLMPFLSRGGFGDAQYLRMAAMNGLLSRTLSARSLFAQGMGNGLGFSPALVGSKLTPGLDGPLNGPSKPPPTPSDKPKPEEGKETVDQFGNVQVGTRTSTTSVEVANACQTMAMGMGVTVDPLAMGTHTETRTVQTAVYAREQGVASNLSHSPETVLALSKIFEDNAKNSKDGNKLMTPEEVQKKLYYEYGIRANVEEINGRKALKFANGDYLMDASGDGALSGLDYNFSGAVSSIKQKYGLSDDDVKAFNESGGFSLEALKQGREQMKQFEKMLKEMGLGGDGKAGLAQAGELGVGAAARGYPALGLQDNLLDISSFDALFYLAYQLAEELGGLQGSELDPYQTDPYQTDPYETDLDLALRLAS